VLFVAASSRVMWPTVEGTRFEALAGADLMFGNTDQSGTISAEVQ